MSPEMSGARPRKNVVSISGGNDSLAVTLVCLATEDPASIELASADTGHEHQITYDYLDYLQDALRMPIRRIKSDFAVQIARKRQYVEEVWTGKA